MPPNLEIDSTSPTHVTVEVLDGIGLNVDSELDRLERWRTTGECTGPTQIGMISLTEEALEILRADMTDGFVAYPDHGTETEAHLVPDEDDYKTPSPEGLAIMNEIQNEFIKMVKKDIEISNQSVNLELWHPKMSIGIYNELSDVHFDQALPKDVDIRYLLTVAGPATTFYTGTFPSDEFVDGDLMQGHDIPETAIPVVQPTGAVLRFLGDCDPHNVPIVENPTFRILCDVTAKATKL